MEIERKFLLMTEGNDVMKAKLAEIGGVESFLIAQYYLATSEDEELRVSFRGDKVVLTYKSGVGLIRNEVETPISESFALQLIKNAQFFIRKTRYDLSSLRPNLILDYIHTLDLWVAEIEYEESEPTDEHIIQILGAFAIEVTGVRQYSSAELAKLIRTK